MVGHAVIHSIAQNDRGLVNLTGIEEYLRDILQGQRLGNALLFSALFGDKIYQASETIIMNDGAYDNAYMLHMNSLRENNEHIFGLFSVLNNILNQLHTLQIFKKNGFIAKRILVYWLVLNIYTCFNENTVATRFECQPPDIIDYLRNDVPPYNAEHD